jgi:hypothetical protein
MKRASLLILAAMIGAGMLVSHTDWSFTKSVEVDHSYAEGCPMNGRAYVAWLKGGACPRAAA